jgi:hypothetical protein
MEIEDIKLVDGLRMDNIRVKAFRYSNIKVGCRNVLKSALKFSIY